MTIRTECPRRLPLRLGTMGVIVACALAATAARAQVPDSDIQALRTELEALKAEVRALKEEMPDSLMHLAGYAHALYTDREGGRDSFAVGSFNPIFHYLYRDLLLLDAEFEVALEDNGETEVALEYMTLSLFAHDYVTVRTGKFLSPIGQFRQALHPAWVNKLPSVPIGFGHDEAAPLSDVGVQLRGAFPLGARVFADYTLYVGNGPRLRLNAAGDEIEAVEAEGQGADNNSNKALGGRLALKFLPRFELGLSAATAKAAGEDANTGNREYDVVAADAAYRFAGVELRGEYVKTKLGAGPVGTIDPDEKEWDAWYAQAAYRLPRNRIEAVLRYGEYQRPGSAGTEQWTPGLNYLFAANVLAKIAYELNDTGDSADDDRLLLQLAYGF